MKTKLIRIGNSQGVRIPKPLIEQAGLEGELELSVEENSVVIKSTKAPRAGWDAQFKEMARRGDDALLDPELTIGSTWDEEEWQW